MHVYDNVLGDFFFIFCMTKSNQELKFWKTSYKLHIHEKNLPLYYDCLSCWM